LTPHLARQLPPLLHSINDLERISDHAINISELTEKLQGQSLSFSNKALAEMRSLYAKVEDIFDETLRAVREEDHFAPDRVMRYEGEVNTLHRQYLEDHSQRLCDRKCEPMNALIFVDFINNLEKIADHLTNIAQASSRRFEYGGGAEDSD
jgi:phosphate:Na+ symporter